MLPRSLRTLRGNYGDKAKTTIQHFRLIIGHFENCLLPYPPSRGTRLPLPFPLHLHTTMSEYIKSTLANLPQTRHSLQSFASYRPNVPNIQFPTTNFQGKNLPARNPRAFVTFAFLLLLLFWKDVIRDVCSHVATRRLPVSAVEVSPIRNNTLGVSQLEEIFYHGRWLIARAVSKHICPFLTRTRRPKNTPPRCGKCD